MFEDQNYATLLRSIGQMLEGLRIDSFALRPDDSGFLVRDQTRSRVQLTPRERTFLAELHSKHVASLDKKDALRLASGVIEWHVTVNDLERLECEGRERRRDDQQTPDSHSVSQILRVIGMILDQKRAKSFRVSKDEQSIVLEYDLPSGQTVSEEFDVPTLYDFWVRMYKKRGHSSVRMSA